MIIVWAPSTASQSAGYGLESNPDEVQYEKEFWKARTVFRFAFRMPQISTTLETTLDAPLCKSMILHGVPRESTLLPAALTTLHEFLQPAMV